MKDAIFLIFQLLTAVVKLIRPGGSRSVIAENLLLKQQLIIHSRSRQRAPNTNTRDRAVLGFISLFLSPRRYSTSNSHLQAIYLALFPPRSEETAVHAGFVDGPALYRMFNDATSRQDWPKRISSNNDPLFQYHRWKANLRVLDIEEIKSLPHVPMSHPFVKRLNGSVRRELLDQTFFWTVTDLENKRRNCRRYYNEHRCHSSRDGAIPAETGEKNLVDINR